MENDNLILSCIEKYQKYFQVKTAHELVERIKYPRLIKSEMIFENTQNISKFKNIFKRVGL